MRKFIDNSVAPIIAWDFDGTINVGGESTYPLCGEPRKYAKEVLNFLHSVGVKNVIWTSRDVSIDQDTLSTHDDITPAIDFMNRHEIEYDAINKSVQFAPYKYNSRKVYAHMYVDDRSFGWYDDHDVLLNVMGGFLSDVLGMKIGTVHSIWLAIHDGMEVPQYDRESVKSAVDEWNNPACQ